MKTALTALLAVLSLTAAAQAQFSSTGWQIQELGTLHSYSIEPGSGRMAEFHAGSLPAPAAGNDRVSASFRVTLPVVAFQHTILKSPPATAGDGRAGIGAEISRQDPVWFAAPELLKADAVGGWLREHDQGANMHEAIDSLVIGAMTEIEPAESGAAIAAATDTRSAPESASFALFGVMALLGAAVARRLTHAA